MPNYQSQGIRARWKDDDMQKAVTAVQSGSMSQYQAVATYKVPRSTLQRYLSTGPEVDKKKLGGSTTLPVDVEEKLKHHVLNMEKYLYGRTRLDVRKLAYELAMKLDIKHKFSHTHKMAGEAWLQGFLRRNPEISIRKPENLSINRATAFNKQAVARFYNNIKEIQKKEAIPPERIYNVDESGISTTVEGDKILAQRGKSRVSVLSSTERGVTTTTVCCMGATGNFIPPMMIFRRLRWAPHLLLEAPGFLGGNSKNGWVNTELFLAWLKHFQKHTLSSPQNKVLLIADNHASHISLEVCEYCRENGIVFLTIPPHTSHKLQPLDVSYFKTLKANYRADIHKWLLNNPGKRVQSEHLGGLFYSAYQRSCRLELAVTGFRVTGISPFNEDVFTEADFAPACNLLQPQVSHEEDRAVEPDINSPVEVSFCIPTGGVEPRARQQDSIILTSTPTLVRLTDRSLRKSAVNNKTTKSAVNNKTTKSTGSNKTDKSVAANTTPTKRHHNKDDDAVAGPSQKRCQPRRLASQFAQDFVAAAQDSDPDSLLHEDSSSDEWKPDE